MADYNGNSGGYGGGQGYGNDRRQGGGRGGYGRGGGGGQHNKRKRDDQEDEKSRLLSSLLELGDNKPGEEWAEVEERVERQASAMRRFLGPRANQLLRFIIDCAVELGTKTPIYAMLIGLLNAEDQGFAAQLVSLAVAEIQAALAAANRHRARMLLRLLAALTVVNVLDASEVLQLLQAVAQSALDIATAGGATDEGRQWQPYTDHLVYSVLMALPWGGPELVAGLDGDRLGPLFDAVEKYMGLRPRQCSLGLAPFSAALSEEDEAAKSDSGGASFLGQVWEAVGEWRTSQQWSLVSVQRLALEQYEAALAVGGTHSLPPLSMPPAVPGVPEGASLSEAAAAVAAAFPPRGIMKLLPTARTCTGGENLYLERLVAEEYILDTIFYYDGDRVGAAGRLAFMMPLPYDYIALLAELLFSQMLTLPRPQLKPIAYACLVVDLCKAMKSFPKSMSGCVRELFARMGLMDTELRGRLAEWLAFQLSNFDFVWPWHKWLHVVKAPPHDAQRHFVVAVLGRMVRLSFYDNVVEKLDKGVADLLPPRPMVRPLPAPGDVAAAEEGVTQQLAAEQRRAAQMLAMVRQHVAMKGQPGWQAQANTAVMAWVDGTGPQPGPQLREEMGGAAGVLRAIVTALLVAGAKSFTHMITALERYGPVLDTLLQESGPAGEEAMVEVAVSVWAASPQRAAMAIDRLMALRLVSGASIVRWVFASEGVRSLDDEVAGSLAWDVLYAVMDKALARTQDAVDDVAAMAPVLADKASAARSAADYTARRKREADDAQEAGLPASVSISDMLDAHERAATQEAGAWQVVRAAEEDLENRKRALESARQEQEDLLLQVLTAFKDILSEAPMDVASGEGTGEAAAKAAWRRFTLGNLRTFARRYFPAAAPLAVRLETEVFAEGIVGTDVRGALLLSFHS